MKYGRASCDRYTLIDCRIEQLTVIVEAALGDTSKRRAVLPWSNRVRRNELTGDKTGWQTECRIKDPR